MAKDMITLHEAVTIILRHSSEIKTERIDFTDSLNRILAEDVFSDMNIPPFNKSAMDGYACRSEDLNMELEIIETIAAGKHPENKIQKGLCAKIMTGAPVPEGADTVVMNEDVEVKENKIFIKSHNSKSNICTLGEDVKKGDKILSEGSLIKPQSIAVLATAGHVTPLIYQKPVVNIIVTGDELVEPGVFPEKSKIRNSNAYQLMSLLMKNGCTPAYKGLVKDNKQELSSAIRESLLNHEILILTGGASKGDFDLVPGILKEEGFSVHFEEVAIQPGKPVCFATKGNNVCFGLSGNPVSSFFQFELLVKPFLTKVRGLKEKEIYLKMVLGESFSRKKAERRYFFPVKINEKFEALPVEFHGSAHISALIEADGIVAAPEGVRKLEKGEFVDVRPL